MDELSLPPRLAWFAPWRWFSEWKPLPRSSLIGLIITAFYCESVVPVVFALEESHLYTSLVDEGIVIVYYPVVWTMDNSTAVRWFYDTQFDFLDWLVES